MNEQQFSELISEATYGKVEQKPVLIDPVNSSHWLALQTLFTLHGTVSSFDNRLLMSGWTHNAGKDFFVINFRYLPEIMTPDLYIKADWGILANVPDETKFYWELDR